MLKVFEAFIPDQGLCNIPDRIRLIRDVCCTLNNRLHELVY